ncbi:putative Ecotin [Trypanosoma vivax]|uniref:Putative ecotin n=1 Tax=Trypanosoma vivax (strain Y486) TaxID=1055687 RepID=G0TVF8_TRYVY|nr:putative ecotin [Trypanosoma vivax]KAH8612060.1 putative Ecotin [Trypanosoma vivax]CCC47924.1 putative ecotin [Trypanosoma vivax Y486]
MSASIKKLEEYNAPYPEPGADQSCCVIFPESKDDEEDNYRLQLIPGLVLEDSASVYCIPGEVREEIIPGWGYSYYVVDMKQQTTLRKWVPTSQREPRFVPLTSKPFIRYNSQLPVVVYMPKGMELHYRVWTPMIREALSPAAA